MLQNMDMKVSQTEITVDIHENNIKQKCYTPNVIERSLSPILTSFHAGYFRVTLSLCSQALLWKSLKEPLVNDPHAFRRVLRMLPSSAFSLFWSLALFTLALLSLLCVLKCWFHFSKVKAEFLHHVGVNYLFAPWISFLLLLQSSPFITPKDISYQVLWWVFITPILALDVKIYGQWFTKGKKFLSMVANPTSQLSVIGNLVGAQAASHMGWKESALFMFSLGMTHYLVLFVTLYQRLPATNNVPITLRPVFFLFIAAPSMASLAWSSIVGTFDNVAKMLFFLSIFLFLSLISRPALFKKSMRKFNVSWWAYSYSLTLLALASAKYEEKMKGIVAHGLMLGLSALSVFVSLILMVFTSTKTKVLLPDTDKTNISTKGSIVVDCK